MLSSNKYKEKIKGIIDLEDEDVYSEGWIDNLVEWDEISDEEAGFMMGYLDSE